MLNICMAYYENPGMLQRHAEAWSRYSRLARARVRARLCDDGSSRAPLTAEIVRRLPLPCAAFRITGPKIPWNQDAARNVSALGTCSADHDEWLLLTDMDHVLTASQVERLLDVIDHYESDPESEFSAEAYTLSRREASTGELVVDADGRVKPHPNTWLLRSHTFWGVGGMDESYRGHYAYTDAEFGRRLRRHCRDIVPHLDAYLLRYTRSDVPDASTTDFPRKEGRDRAAIRRIRNFWAGPRTGLSTYERIA